MQLNILHYTIENGGSLVGFRQSISMEVYGNHGNFKVGTQIIGITLAWGSDFTSHETWTNLDWVQSLKLPYKVKG